jgi:ectoine hydrolase
MSALPFSDAEYSHRVAGVRRVMAERGVDTLLVCSPHNFYYLTGFQAGGSHSLTFLILPLEGDAIWICRRTELSNVRALSGSMWAKDHVGVADGEDVIDVLIRTLKERGLAGGGRRIGVEYEAMFFSVGHYLSLREQLGETALCDGTGIVETMRITKSETELGYLRAAGKITAGALQACYEAVREGVTDTELGAVLTGAAIRLGSDRMGCQPFLSVGARTAMAHAFWKGDHVNKGEVINAEVACAVARYHVPTFRVMSVGEPSAEIRRMHAASEKGLEAGLKGIKPGMSASDADAVVRGAIDKTGYGDAFVVRAAYGIGLAFPPSWGESPVMNIRPGEARLLKPGMTFHLVPALYVDGVGCVCCSMPIEVTGTGVAGLTPIEPKLFVA